MADESRALGSVAGSPIGSAVGSPVGRPIGSSVGSPAGRPFGVRADSLDWYALDLHASGVVVHAIDELARRLNEDPGQVLVKAVALLKAAVDAHEQGKAVGVAASPESLETEFVGF